MTPTYSIPSTFLGTTNTDRNADVVVAGISLDIGTTNRSGTRDGPAAIRRASRMLVDGLHPTHWTDAISGLADIGDFSLALGDLSASMRLIEQQATDIQHLIAVGGEHSITLPLLRALHRRIGSPLALVHFDAHVDTWPDNFGQPYAHGSVFYHAINIGLVDPKRMVQIGIRSPVQREVMEWTQAQGVRSIIAQTVHESSPGYIAEIIRDISAGSPTYFSFDVDCLDPAFAPGTGTPEIGGLASWQIQAILRDLREVNFVGADVVEIAPAYDIAEITALAGATVAWEYLSLLAKKT